MYCSGSIYRASTAKIKGVSNAIKAIFIKELLGSKREEFLKDVWISMQYYDKPKTFTGRCGKAIVLKEYVGYIEKYLFGREILGYNKGSKPSKGYCTVIKNSFNDIAKAIQDDIKSGCGTDDYIIYKNREDIKACFKELKRVGVSVPSSAEKDLEKLRRLEGFDNKIIEIKKTGLSYPVDSELKWEKGENILYLTARLYFLNLNLSLPKEEFESRKNNTIKAFKLWGNHGSAYSNVYKNQSVKVKMTLTEAKFPLDTVPVYLDSQKKYSFSWGGHWVIGWRAGAPKAIFLSDSDQTSGTAAHELGHTLGLGDAYETKYIKGIYYGDGVDYDKYPQAEGTIMESLKVTEGKTTPTSKDIEMVIEAHKTGKRQNFQRESFFDVISPILGK